ncbi:MAG: ABC transporter ATP-binding protein [Christensenellaceae bacterium]|nr:ABC transporter ATP-binding protein [Christensenellaceae bacterium]
MREMIEVVSLQKAFKEQVVLRNVNLSVSKGTITGLVGDNGSGKSVLLKCICGLMIPDRGTVWLGEKRVGKDMDFPSNVGALIEAPGFLPRESGYDNLYYLWSIRKMVPLPAIERSMEVVGLSARDRKPVGKYSMGMRQRLGIAQALMEDPEILILDEPFNGLDKHGRAEMYEVMNDLRQAGKTMLITSHYALDIEKLCEAVYEIDVGEAKPLGASG